MKELARKKKKEEKRAQRRDAAAAKRETGEPVHLEGAPDGAPEAEEQQ